MDILPRKRHGDLVLDEAATDGACVESVRLLEELPRRKHGDRFVPRADEISPDAGDEDGTGSRSGTQIDFVVWIPQAEDGVDRLNEQAPCSSSATISRRASR